MKLTRLRLIGFKSFVEPTDFLIEPGLTGVVGPNGCGKSNLVEALRWVMGETSHKAMRAADMDDVIFSGNNTRPARNHAEVGSRIDNAEPHRAGPVQRRRDARRVAAHRARARLDLSDQRPRGARARRRNAIRGRLDRRAFARAGASRAASARSSRPSPSSAAACSRRRPAFPACTRAATRPSCGCMPPSTICMRVEDVIGQLAAQVDGAQAPGPPGGALSHISRQVRRAEAMLFHLRWLAAKAEVSGRRARQERGRARRRRPHRWRRRSVATRQTEIAARHCRPCATPRPAPPRRCIGS